MSVAEAERAAQMHARAFERGLGLDEPLNRRMDIRAPIQKVFLCLNSVVGIEKCPAAQDLHPTLSGGAFG